MAKKRPAMTGGACGIGNDEPGREGWHAFGKPSREMHGLQDHPESMSRCKHATCFRGVIAGSEVAASDPRKHATAMPRGSGLTPLQPAFPGPASFFGNARRSRRAGYATDINDIAIDYRHTAHSAPLWMEPNVDAGRILGICGKHYAAWADQVACRLAAAAAHARMPMAKD